MLCPSPMGWNNRLEEYGKLVLKGVIAQRALRASRGGRSSLSGSDRRELDRECGFDAW